MANLNTFVQKLAGGGARANQFEVSITGGPFAATDLFTFLCRGAQVPAQTIGEVPVPYRGRQIYVAGDRLFDAWTVTVFSDAAWNIRSQLEQWSNLMQNMGSDTTGATSPDAYYGTAEVRQMDRNEATVNTYSLYQIWPTVIDPIDLAYDTNDVIEEFGVTWRFNYMTSSGGGGTV
ncbi:MAG: hypothetical protein QF704_06290 [Anaerolineales bacterium]|jgi:hypothetical protein|nr:hypothetical protein [Anaerolineales bacterium]MDP6770287.1 hypothetical protein [Anaerolineales bacterium]|tara:strand:+ start:421 stop:948 length:528 start_codon:yes stop_codon:yes gene_type:complete